MQKNHIVKIKDIKFSNQHKLHGIFGPCVVESEQHCMMMAEKIHDICHSYGFKFIFKASYKKANRTSKDSFTGIGDEKALEVLAKIGDKFSIPTISDIHSPEEAELAAKYVNVLQIPSLLSRQSDLMYAAGETGLPVHIKKGQFMAPEDIINVIEKVKSTGNDKIIICERGSCFGYRTLINDFTGMEIMKQTGYPIIYDVSHSVQKMSGAGNKSTGNRDMIFPLARAGAGLGLAGIFCEVHNNPDNALSDGPNSLKLEDLPKLLKQIIAIDNVVKSFDNPSNN